MLFSIRVGSTIHKNGQKHTISKIIMHPNYNHDNSNNNDLAILKVR